MNLERYSNNIGPSSAAEGEYLKKWTGIDNEQDLLHQNNDTHARVKYPWEIAEQILRTLDGENQAPSIEQASVLLQGLAIRDLPEPIRGAESTVSNPKTLSTQENLDVSSSAHTPTYEQRLERALSVLEMFFQQV